MIKYKRVYVLPSGKLIARIETASTPEKDFVIASEFIVNELGLIIG